jgi:hypothetical protein
MHIKNKNLWFVHTKQAFTDGDGLLLAICPSKKKAKAFIKQSYPKYKKEPKEDFYIFENMLVTYEKFNVDVVK